MDKNDSRFSYLETLSTEDLQTYIVEDFYSPGSHSEEEINAVLEILVRRREAQGLSIDVDAAWEKFQQLHPDFFDPKNPGKPRGEKKRRRLASFLALLLVLVALLVITPTIFGENRIYTNLAQWSDSIFSFFSAEAEPIPITTYADQSGLSLFYSTVQDFIGERKIVPTWLPDGFQLTEITIIPSAHDTTYQAAFLRDSQYLTVLITTFSEKSMQYTKDETPVECEELHGIKHYFFQNNAYANCVWVNGDLECSVSGPITQAELHAIIESIYGGNEA